MLFDESKEWFSDGLYEETHNPAPAMNEDSEAIRQASMGFVRTNNGIVVRSMTNNTPATGQIPANDVDGEMYFGDDYVGPEISTEWAPISSSDLFNLRRLGVAV